MKEEFKSFAEKFAKYIYGIIITLGESPEDRSNEAREYYNRIDQLSIEKLKEKSPISTEKDLLEFEEYEFCRNPLIDFKSSYGKENL